MAEPDRYFYFAYGANLDRQAMQDRCPDSEPLCRAVLPDYRLVFRGVADIESADGSQVCGALYVITLSDLQRLDWFEGYPSLYRRQLVEVFDEQNESHQAIVYMMTSRRTYSPPFDGYLLVILSGCQQWGISEEYQDDILSLAQNT